MLPMNGFTPYSQRRPMGDTYLSLCNEVLSRHWRVLNALCYYTQKRLITLVPEGVIVIVSSQKPDQILDTFEAVVVFEVLCPVEGAQGRASGFQLHCPVHS